MGTAVIFWEFGLGSFWVGLGCALLCCADFSGLGCGLCSMVRLNPGLYHVP